MYDTNQGLNVPGFVDAMINYAKESEDRKLCAIIVEKLGNLYRDGSSKALLALEEMAKHFPNEVAPVLGKIGSPEAFGVIRRMISNDMMCVGVVNALNAFATSEAMAILKNWKGMDLPGFDRYLVDELMSIGTPETLDLLVREIERAKIKNYFAAMEMLSFVSRHKDYEKVVGVLSRVWEGDSPFFRCTIAETLRSIHSPGLTISVLKNMLESEQNNPEGDLATAERIRQSIEEIKTEEAERQEREKSETSV